MPDRDEPLKDALSDLVNVLQVALATKQRRELWLDPIPAELRDKAVAELAAGEVESFLFYARNQDRLDLVLQNCAVLEARGLYERALVDAFSGTEVATHQYPLSLLHCLFEIADRERLRAAGEPLPGAGPFTVYRGVAGHGRARRVRGLSWTASLERAKWFANRWFSGGLGLVDPAVFCLSIAAEDVLFYINNRQEEEFVIRVPPGTQPTRVWRLPADGGGDPKGGGRC
jgi:hypothetical protein